MAPTPECLDGIACVFSSDEFKKFEEQVGVKPCEACDGPLPDCATCEGLDCGNCDAQIEADAAHIRKWIADLKQIGFVPSDEEISEELERYVYREDTLLFNVATARARRGL